MNMNLPRVLSFAAVAAAVAGVWWFAGLLSAARDGAATDELRPGFSMGDFAMRGYDARGALQYRATGKSMTEYPAEDAADYMVEIERLEMSQYPPIGAPTEISARRARLSGDDILALEGGAHVRREKTKVNGALDIKTEALLVDGDARYMETDRPFTIKTDGNEVDGVGLRAWPEKEEYHIGKPRGRHAP